MKKQHTQLQKDLEVNLQLQQLIKDELDTFHKEDHLSVKELGGIAPADAGTYRQGKKPEKKTEKLVLIIKKYQSQQLGLKFCN